MNNESFDWNSKELTFENAKDSRFDMLMSYLIVPSIDDLLPYLKDSEFPCFFIENPAIWKSALTEFAPQYEKAIDDFHEWAETGLYPLRDQVISICSLNYGGDPDETIAAINKLYRASEFHTRKRAWKVFLEVIAAKASKPDAIKVEQWIYRHCVSQKYNDAMSGWWRIFCHATDMNMPDFLKPIIQEIHQVMKPPKYWELQDEINSIHAKYRKENNLENMFNGYDPYMHEHRPPYIPATTVIHRAYVHIKTRKVLELISETLSAKQIDSLVQWAENLASTMSGSRKESLCGQELIASTLPFSSTPSILNNKL